METFKPNYSFRGRAALLASACLIVPLTAGEPRGSAGLAESELSRRSVAIEEAQELLRKGDEAYTGTRYKDAVEAYAGARELIPDAPISAELRDAATQRYAQASVEYARELSRNGDVAGAKAAVDKVLIKSVAPDNPGALDFRNQLDDPIRTNPALTKEHTQNVDSVRKLLYTAEGAYNLGDYDKAKRNYESAIRIDSTNTAARRGLERVAQAKSDYSKSGYDHARAEMLAEVDKGWETPLSPVNVEPTFGDANMGLLDKESVTVKNKLDRIIIPKFALDQASLEEALDFLRLRSAENDTTELDPSHKGVNFTVNLGAPDSPAATRIRKQRFDLQLSQVPLSQVLKYITEITQTSFSTDDFSVNISPLGSTSAELVSRTYRVPPDFISSISSGSATSAAEPADPFAEAPASRGLLAKRLGAQEALVQQGVGFPQGASASYTPANNLLRIINTESNQEFIAQIIETMTKTEPVMVSVTVTMIKVEQNRLEELGFDWLLNNIGFGGESWVPGNDRLNLSGGTTGNQRPITDTINPPANPQLNPITAGNRSGDYAISGNNIDNLLTSQLGRQVQKAAPGIFALRGEIDNATVETIMRGLDQKTGVDVVIKPSVVTRSGQQSSIHIVREFMFPDEYEPPELPNSTGDTFGGGGSTPVTPSTPTSFKERDVGVTLDVVPVVAENKQSVNVKLNPVFTEFDGFVNYGSPINSTQQGLLGPEDVLLTPNAILEPIFSVKKLDTEVDVTDGATMVVGGLIQETVQNVEDQTPILGSIPIIGRLFQSKATQKISTAIIFLIGVEVMDPTGRRYRDR
ncbi:MAG: Amuc_1098 family type IV pilus outer membrane protein [Luteolibacter sp.]|uniref:Amuc_1098 family type IV pilus outer membrane protein n=1 Tax=Luteolibacter sp. TaxID=1962973 RepID=UPI0032660829